MHVIESLGTCIGYEALNPVTATGFTSTEIKPTTGTFANFKVHAVMVVPESFQIRVRIEGTAPTATVGALIAAGGAFVVEGADNITNFKCIDTASGAATVHCLFFV